MAAAFDLGGFAATKTKHAVRERPRAPKAGAFGLGYESKEARRERDREAGKLDDGERGELLFLWSGFDAALGVKSVQGAVEDRLMRSPPRVGPELERQVEEELLKRGKAGAQREKLVEILSLENNATRHEASLALRRMVGAGRIEYFVEQTTRSKECRCRLGLGDQDRKCRCGAGAEETVPREMARLVLEKSRAIPPAIPPEERWRRKDDALREYCNTIHCSESSFQPGSRLPPEVQSSRADAARRALRALSAPHRRTIERAYGSALQPVWAGLSPEAARLAPYCPSVERARLECVDRKMRNWNPECGHDLVTRRSIDKGVFASDALRMKLDQAPEDEVTRTRWRYEREAFCKAVEREAYELLRVAVSAYREARGQ
jgi:hypothetical protein